jgi:hypothetical protein
MSTLFTEWPLVRMIDDAPHAPVRAGGRTGLAPGRAGQRNSSASLGRQREETR